MTTEDEKFIIEAYEAYLTACEVDGTEPIDLDEFAKILGICIDFEGEN